MLHRSIVKSRKRELAECVTCVADNRNAYKISFGKAEGKGPLLKSMHRRRDNIKIDLTIGCLGADYLPLCGDHWRALQYTAVNFRGL